MNYVAKTYVINRYYAFRNLDLRAILYLDLWAILWYEGTSIMKLGVNGIANINQSYFSFVTKLTSLREYMSKHVSYSMKHYHTYKIKPYSK